jgi:hypothetical protein
VSKNISPNQWRGAAVSALLAIAANCAQMPPTRLEPIASVPASNARIWFYRDGGPRDAQQRPYIRLNDQIVGISEPDGAIYRDVRPGHYQITVDSYLSNDVDQFAVIDLSSGEETYIEVLSQGQRVSDRAGRENFFTRVIPAETARTEVSRRRFYGGS